jgi:hypothetical protein
VGYIHPTKERISMLCRRAVRCVARLQSAAIAASALYMFLGSQNCGGQGPPLQVEFSRAVSPHWFDIQPAAEAVTPAPGADEIVALGELNLPGDGPADPAGFRLLASDQTSYPLHIDRSTVVREFGKIVFCRFFVVLPARLADQEGLVMQWGAAVRAQNRLVSGIRPDPARRADYREIVFRPAPAAEAAEERQLALKVVVDRHRSRYRLLYLLPIVLVLAAALIRKWPDSVRGDQQA